MVNPRDIAGERKKKKTNKKKHTHKHAQNHNSNTIITLQNIFTEQIYIKII